MRLYELELTNFKGSGHRRIQLDGRNIKIMGTNETGKTTIRDAFLWLLTGKDGAGRADYEIKTYDSAGKVIPRIDHTVRGVIEHNGERLELIRTYRESWTRPRGTNEEVFTGHETIFLVNGIEKKAKEYQAVIDGLVAPQLIRLLSVVGYFNEQIKPEERRKMLIDMRGDIRDEEIMERPEFAELRPLVGPRVTVADIKTQKVKDKTSIDDEINAIPIEIATHNKYLNLGGLNAETERAAADEIEKQILTAESEKSALYSGEYFAGLKRELAELRGRQLEARNKTDGIMNEKRADIRRRAGEVSDKHAEIMGKVALIAQQINGLEDTIKRLETDKSKLLKIYDTIFSEEFTGTGVCPTCGKRMGAAIVEASRAKFNEAKATRIEENVKAGQALKTEIEAKEKKRDELAAEKTILLGEAAALRKQQEEIETEYGTIKAPYGFDDSLIPAKETEITEFNASVAERAAAYDTQIRTLRDLKTRHDDNLALLKHAADAAASIEALKVKEKTKKKQFEECERMINLCEQFSRAKVKLLDEKISGAFRMTQFRLSEIQVNGGIKDVCEAMVPNEFGVLVPYGATNTAARINCGLDIISVFQARYKTEMPVFIDGRESIVKPLDMPCQVISLIVSEADKELRMEVE